MTIGKSFSFTRILASDLIDSHERHSPSVSVELVSGAMGSASIPAKVIRTPEGVDLSASAAEAAETIRAVNDEITEGLLEREFSSLDEVDQAMCELDGTADKSRLGARAIVAVSKATARALATQARQPLFAWLPKVGAQRRLPMPCFNVLSGGSAAQTHQTFRGFLVCPLGAETLADAVQTGVDVYAALGERVKAAGYGTEVGDECGYLPAIGDPAEVVEMITGAISDAGYELGEKGAAIGLNVAASNFRNEDGTYLVNDQRLSTDEMIELFAELTDRFPIYGIEDGVGDTDTDGWRALTDRLGDRVRLIGDDHFSTSVAEISRAVEAGFANTALIKLNQIGSVSETVEAMRICEGAGYEQIVAYRFGETPDTFIADFTVASGCGLVRTGAPVSGHGTSKYNRLSEISEQWKGSKRSWISSRREPLAYGRR